MEDNGHEGERIKEEFARRRRVRLICRVLLISSTLALVLPLLVLMATGGSVVVRVALAVAWGVIILGMDICRTRTWRCPACDARLGTALNATHCPSCGVELQ